MSARERADVAAAPSPDPSDGSPCHDHVVVSLPSHSMPARLLERHASHLPALEHRALLDGLVTAHDPAARVVVVTSSEPAPEVLDHYARLARPDDPDDARRRVTCLVVPDDGPRGIAAKLLDRPDLLDRLRRQVGATPAVIEPWNVTDDELAVAQALGVPLNGGPAELWPLGFKSASRRLFRECDVAVPVGVEAVRSSDEVAVAVRTILRERPLVERVVVKLDNSGAGEGNLVLPVREDEGRPLPDEALVAALARLSPPAFLRDLSLGGVVEELVTGEVVGSPSAQVEIGRDGEVVVRATHEQLLGGEDGQVFIGSRFPADAAHAAEVATQAAAVARRLAERGAVGWLSVDFVAARGAGGRTLVAVDLNLRKGGTSHSYAALRHLAPGVYETQSGRWLADDGGERHYRSSDDVEVGRGVTAARVIAALEAAGLAFDPVARTGVVLHMFPSLDDRGTVGATAIGRTAEEAERLFDAASAALRTA
ncbi:peptide ligase PGM1-related protein [Phycicoccus jejuensis]|uniref:peptide ligase PGM1-related protein n=1 Tax=Phycicoccus jejuensis TaxID=367299 RepID=UPI00384AA3A7